MYEVYSAQRPGRPRRSLLAAIILLLLAVGAAEILILYRERAALVQLGPRNQYPEGQLSVCLPAGWRPVDRAVWPTGAIVGVEKEGTDGRQKRFFVFRGPPSHNGLAVSAGFRELVAVSRELGADVLFADRPAPASVGAFPGVTAVMGKRAGSGGVQSPFCLGRAAVGPGGELVGVVLQADEPPRRADETLVEQVAQSMELPGISLNADAQDSMAAAGISFETPGGVRFIGPVDPEVPRLRLMSDQAGRAWYLDVYRVPLIGRRKVADLVEDRAMSIVQEVRLREPVESFDAAGREAARVHLAIVSGQEPTVHLLAVKTDEHTALLMVGRFKAEAGGEVRKACESIAATARVNSYDELVDLGSAAETARMMIQDCRKAGISSLVGRHERKRRRFEVKAPGISLGSWAESCRRSSEQNDLPWELTGRWVYQPKWLGHDRLVVSEGWRLAENGVRYNYALERTDGGRITIQQTEESDAEGRRATRIVNTSEGSRTENIELDETFACGPLLTEVCARIANGADPKPLIVSIIETFTAGAAYCVVKPIGRTSLPGSSLRSAASTVRLMVDYDPEPVLMFFDDDGELLAVSFDGRQWRERVELPAETEESPGAERRPGR